MTHENELIELEAKLATVAAERDRLREAMTNAQVELRAVLDDSQEQHDSFARVEADNYVYMQEMKIKLAQAEASFESANSFIDQMWSGTAFSSGVAAIEGNPEWVACWKIILDAIDEYRLHGNPEQERRDKESEIQKLMDDYENLTITLAREREQVWRLREALAPLLFASMGVDPDWEDDMEVEVNVTIGDIRNARSALAASQATPEAGQGRKAGAG